MLAKLAADAEQLAVTAVTQSRRGNKLRPLFPGMGFAVDTRLVDSFHGVNRAREVAPEPCAWSPRSAMGGCVEVSQARGLIADHLV